MKKYFLLLTVFVFVFVSFIFADRYAAEESFFAMQEVMVVSASRRAQRISDAPVTISVVSREDIEDMGVQSIPEALRMVAGVYVQQTLGGQYEVSLRGTSNMPGSGGPTSVYSRNILVLIDGRSFFNDLFGGTIWEFLPLTINDIERIEVVRGPASALFGANAATGVINIITRDPSTVEEQLLSLSTSFGPDGREKHNMYYAENFDNVFISFSYERNQKERFNYEEYDATKESFSPGKGDPNDDNFPTADKKSLKADKVMVALNYEIDDDNTLDFKAGMSHGHQNFMGASGDFLIPKLYMEQKYGKLTFQKNISDNILKLTYSRLLMLMGEDDGPDQPVDFKKDGVQNGLGLYSDDFELEGIFSVSENSTLVTGFNARFLEGKSDAVYFKGQNAKQNFKAVYLNYDYSIIPDRLRIVPAIRIDKYNTPDITEASPQFSVFYRHDDNHTFKFNYSEAIRASFLTDIYTVALVTPSALRRLHNLLIPAGINIDSDFIEWRGVDNLDVPRVRSFEISYLTKPTSLSNLDVSVFTHTMDNAIGFEFIGGNPYPFMGNPSTPSVSLNFKNIDEQYKTYGVELSYKMLLMDKWNFWSNMTYQSMKLGSEKYDFTPAYLMNAGITGKLTDNLKLTASLNYASQTEVPINNVLDRTLDILANTADIPQNITEATLTQFINTFADTSSPTTYHNLLSAQGSAVYGTLVHYATEYQTALATPNLANAQIYGDSMASLFGAILTGDEITIFQYSGQVIETKDGQVLGGVGQGILVSELLKSTAGKTVIEETDSYLLLNLRLAYSITENTEFAVSAVNLLDNKHRQYPYGEKLGGSYLATLRMNF